MLVSVILESPTFRAGFVYEVEKRKMSKSIWLLKKSCSSGNIEYYSTTCLLLLFDIFVSLLDVCIFIIKGAYAESSVCNIN